MDTKSVRVVTYQEELPLIMLLDTSITCLFEVKRHIKYFTSPLALNAHQRWKGGDIP